MNRSAAEADAVLGSGLFDRDFYLGQNAEIRQAGIDPAAHFVRFGLREGRRPNFFFDPAWYADRYLAADQAGDALFHYLTIGERQGCDPSPYFDATWYARTYELDLERQNALAHYLAVQYEHRQSPNAIFDTPQYVASNRDILKYRINAFIHYLKVGVFEGRICKSFNAEYMWRAYLANDRSRNPIELFFAQGQAAGWRTFPDPAIPSLAREIRTFTNPGPEFEAEAVPIGSGRTLRGKVVAFYLPQYHAIPENDAWWGTGFTEWRNIARGVPRFVGHQQPRVPRDLGFYNLDDPTNLRRQAELARRMGIHGFCFYYYNFDGKRLLERPVEAFLADTSLEMPFCLIWANENWTRRWDGMEHDVLMRQGYDPADAPALIADIARHMRDTRYIRCGERPVFFLYRPDIIPDCAETIALWRRLFREQHGLDPIIAMAQTFNTNDPRPLGFDGAIEFPPHKLSWDIRQINASLTVLDDDFEGQVRAYDDFVSASARYDDDRDFPLIKSALPGWDNDARRQGKGSGVIHGSTPGKFEAWLDALLDRAQSRPFFGEPFVFVNAWNEWCEGAYLEPDVHHGYAYLNALARAVANRQPSVRPRILLVGHDAFPAGAQYLLLNLADVLTHRFGFEAVCVLLDGGALADRYRAMGRTLIASEEADFAAALGQVLSELQATGCWGAITNTVFGGELVDDLKARGFAVCSLIHELPEIIRSRRGEPLYESICKGSDVVVYPSAYVREALEVAFPPATHRCIVRHQGLYHPPVVTPHSRDAVRRQLGIPADSAVVIGVGYGDARKGVDLFVELATRMTPRGVHFVWVGDLDPQMQAWIERELAPRRPGNLHFTGFSNEVGSYLAAADLFALTSREDPFPSAVLEALAAGLPVVAFDRGTGAGDVIVSDPRLGRLVPYLDVVAAETAVLDVLGDPLLRSQDARAARERLIDTHFSFDAYAFDIASLVRRCPSISVVVPNYNYRRYLEGRLSSVFAQSHPVFEVIVLDDGSTDGSSDEVERIATTTNRDFIYAENTENSGSVFRQWQRACELARGDLIWIAEADDSAAPEFLEALAPLFDDPEMLIAFSDSTAVDDRGHPLRPSYKDYYELLFPGALQSDTVVDTEDFLRRYLSVRNPILNVSAVLWRRDVLRTVLDRCSSELGHYKLAGDWRLYIETCMLAGRIGYRAAPLNVHRRHETSVTQALDARAHVGEIEAIHAVLRRTTAASDAEAARRDYIEALRGQFGLLTSAG